MPERIAVEFESSAGERVTVEWDEEALRRLAASDGGGKLPWRLAGELDWDEIESLRVLSGRLGDGRALAIAALRPAGAAGHGDEIVAGMLSRNGGFEQLEQVLISTEYGADGVPRRLNLELYTDSAAIPIRVAATVTATAETATDGPRPGLIHVSLALRHDGESGTATYDLMTG